MNFLHLIINRDYEKQILCQSAACINPEHPKAFISIRILIVIRCLQRHSASCWHTVNRCFNESCWDHESFAAHDFLLFFHSKCVLMKPKTYKRAEWEKCSLNGKVLWCFWNCSLVKDLNSCFYWAINHTHHQSCGGLDGKSRGWATSKAEKFGTSDNSGDKWARNRNILHKCKPC